MPVDLIRRPQRRFQRRLTAGDPVPLVKAVDAVVNTPGIPFVLVAVQPVFMGPGAQISVLPLHRLKAPDQLVSRFPRGGIPAHPIALGHAGEELAGIFAVPLTFVQPVVVGMSEGFKEVGVALQHVLKPGCLMGGQPPSHIAGRRKTVQRVVAGADHGGNLLC